MRAGTIETGIEVANAMKPTVPSRNENAIGMPIAMEATTKTTKNSTRLAFPMSCRAGPNHDSMPAAPATIATAAATCRQSATRNRFWTAVISISTMPTTTAAPR